MAIGIASQPMLEAEYATLNPATTVTDGDTNMDSRVIPVYDCEVVTLQGFATGGNGSCAEDVEFRVVASFDGETFDTDPYATLFVTLNGTTPVVFSGQLPVTGIHSLKILNIYNNETVGGRTATSLNIKLGKTYPLKG